LIQYLLLFGIGDLPLDRCHDVHHSFREKVTKNLSETFVDTDW